jgi:hypothetical protein
MSRIRWRMAQWRRARWRKRFRLRGVAGVVLGCAWGNNSPLGPPLLARKIFEEVSPALTKAFIQPHSTQTQRKLTQPVTIWQPTTPLKDWLYFYSVNKDRLYRKHENNSWKIYTYHGGAIRNRRYKFTNLTCSTKPSTATWLTSVSP